MKNFLLNLSRVVHHKLTSYIPVMVASVSRSAGEIAQTVVFVAKILVPPPSRE